MKFADPVPRLCREDPLGIASRAGAPIDVGAVASALARLRAAPPRVHALVAPVAQPLVANVAAALGIDISMTVDADEVGPMAAASDAICVNLGMLDPQRRAGITSALASNRPFVLDPVKVDRVPARLAFARELLDRGPVVVKGNAAEMRALGPVPNGTVSVTTGPVDRLTVRSADGTRAVSLANGTPRLDGVIATGCAAGMLIAATVAVEADPLVAAVAGLGLMNVAGESATATAAGPGSFAVHLLDALGNADSREIAGRLRYAADPVDPSLYLILGPEAGELDRLLPEAVAGGVTLVQWRDKSGDTASQVRAVRALVEASPVPVLVNDRADVALAAGAAGIHVGHGDLTAAEARALVGPTAIVGLTVHSLAEADAAAGAPIDYASVGGVFTTTSKVNPNPPIGVDGFRRIAERLRRDRPGLPVIAIAGIDGARSRELAAAGADGVAVLSAITKADDPRAAAAALRRALEEGRS